MHGLEVYEKEGLPFARDLSLENSVDFYLFSTGFTSLRLTSFSSINHLPRLYAWSLIPFHNIDEVLSIDPSAEVFLFGDFDVPHKNYLILVKLIDLVNYVIIFLPQITLLRWLTFLLKSLPVTLTVLPFWIYFF